MAHYAPLLSNLQLSLHELEAKQFLGLSFASGDKVRSRPRRD
jgi:hypothetical protein